MPERRRTTLTPLESELRARESVAPATPGLVTRFRRRLRRERRGPTTVAGAILHGLVRLGLAVAVASGIALVLAHVLHRSAALGFYIVGGALLAVAFGTSTGLGRAAAWQAYTYGADTQVRRFNLGVAYVVAGAVVIAIAVAIEAAR